MGSKKRVSVKDTDGKWGKGIAYPAPKLPPLPTFERVGGGSALKAAPQAVKGKKASRAKPLSRVEGRGSRAKKGASRVQRQGSSAKHTPATRNSSRATAAQSPDLSAQVSELQAQIAALRASLEHSTPVTSNPQPVTAAQQPLATSYPPLDHAVVAQREGGTQLSTLDSRPSTRAGAKPLPIYELKQTRPVGYQSSDLLDSTSEESQDGFFTGLLDRARMQWLMGDWEGLGMIRLEAIKGHPDKARLALLAAAGCLQTGKFIEGKIFMRMALDWGANRRMAAMFLVSGAHHSIGKAATVAKDTRRGALHFERAKTAIDFPGNSNQKNTSLIGHSSLRGKSQLFSDVST